MLLSLVRNNIPISLEGSLNFIYTQISITVNIFTQKTMYRIQNCVDSYGKLFVFI